MNGLSVFEFGAMTLLSPVLMTVLAKLILREKSSFLVWPAIFLGVVGGWFLMEGEWDGWSSVKYHFVMLVALIFSSLRWIVVKYVGERVPTSAFIFWEPILVLLSMGLIVDLYALWSKFSPILLSSAVLLFLSRQFLVRSYQNRSTTATSISSLIYTKLIWTLLFSYLFWSNLPKPIELLGVFLIVISSMLIVFPSSKSS